MEVPVRVTRVEASNFGSYKHLEFDFDKQGLCLIQGPTGSGKSTLCDLIPWVLFGRTAKGGTVNEVISWPGGQETKVTLYLENVTIHRKRGPNGNDLMFWPVGGQVTRGKDLADTQKLINEFLKLDYDTYLAGAYYHEFSPTAGFFTANAKARRAMCEQLVDLSLAVKLQEALSLQHKDLNKQLDKADNDIYTLSSNILLITNTYTAEMVRHNAWETDKKKQLELLSVKDVNFEVDKTSSIKEAQDLVTKWENDRTERLAKLEIQLSRDPAFACEECGQTLNEEQHEKHNKRRIEKILLESNNLTAQTNPYLRQLQLAEKTTVNPYPEQIVTLKRQANPHKAAATELALKRADRELELKTLETSVINIKEQLVDVETLQDVAVYYRSLSINNIIKQLETSTNKLLTDHYDAEIRVSFSASTADKLDVIIMKDGNECSFTQLSKGQRQLLKLCFGLSAMQAVSNFHGVRFNQIFLDEAVDGLDESLKIKTYGLLKTLSLQYDSVFVVEHSQELKNLFEKSFVVAINNGESSIEEA